MQVGSQLGKYRIVAHLKTGGMANLYLARRSGAAGFARHVAIKVVHPHLAGDRNFVRMFIDEALLSARISHPSVVHVEELGEENGTYFLVMEYVHGCSLAQLVRGLALKQLKLSPELATCIAIRVAEGLHAAHETCDDQGKPLGVVHRDVSPQNVLLGYNGHVKVIDFGIAKASSRQQTTTRSLKGKLRYMAPEQAFGRPVDRRTDVYAVGVMLWEMLAMRRLFHADDDFALLDLVRDPKVIPPSQISSDVPDALDRVVMMALAKNADERPATAQELRRHLADAVPRAPALDAADLAALLAEVMAEEIRGERELLPESISKVLDDVSLPTDERTRRERLSVLTRAAPDVEIDIDLGDDFPSSSAELPRRGTPMATEAADLGTRAGERRSTGVSWKVAVGASVAAATIAALLAAFSSDATPPSAASSPASEHATVPVAPAPRAAAPAVEPSRRTNVARPDAVDVTRVPVVTPVAPVASPTPAIAPDAGIARPEAETVDRRVAARRRPAARIAPTPRATSTPRATTTPRRDTVDGTPIVRGAPF